MSGFFDEPSENSIVKATIVEKYFSSWANVVVAGGNRNGRQVSVINYVDLFCGPGRYGDGTKSTPIRILDRAVETPMMREKLRCLFNDKDPENSRSLVNAIGADERFKKFRHQPKVHSFAVSDQVAKAMEDSDMAPTLCFIDPWGYKGLSARLVNAAVKDWGCDCIFFFNYNRIRAGVSNPVVREHMEGLFGDKLQDLQMRLQGIAPADAELLVVDALCQELSVDWQRYVLPFCFKDSRGTRTSHHLIFVSKSFKGYEIMKEIMHKESSRHAQDVASFEYSQADERFPVLFEFSRPLDDLEALLARQFAGQTVSVRDLYEKHSNRTPFVLKNYKSVLVRMEASGKITASPPKSERRAVKGVPTMANHVRVTFQPR